MFTRRQSGSSGVGTAIAGLFGGVSRADKFEVSKADAEWQRVLSKEQFYVMRHRGTEAPGSSALADNHAVGTYHCAGCDQPLFASDAKFESGTGWPSFDRALSNSVATSTDYFMLIPRTEVHCRRCGSHLGHVFSDGPAPTGQRYCTNGVSLKFVPADS